jgi:hypothetical protein
MEMHPLWMLVDPYIIWFYRLSGYAFADFLFGTFFLAWMALLVGEFTISVVFLSARRRIDAATHEARHYQDLSAEALSAGDKAAYRAANKLANDAFGRSFFMQIALSAAFLWPIFVALAWMNQRFANLEFPLLFTDYALGCIGVFIVLYAAAYLIFKKIKYKLPYFRRIKTILDSYQSRTGETKSVADVLPAVPRSEKQ